MRRDEALQVLREHRAELEALGARSIALFGSVARDEARADSDVDVLVELRRPAGLFAFVTLQMRLQELLQRRVDLVTPDAIRPIMREQILRDAIDAG